MLSPLSLFLVVIAYLSVLFALAYYAESRERAGRSIVSNPYVYSLSLAVYCTSWTFYGSVGKAAGSGLSFITTYLGPTLAASLWWVVLRKIITTAKRHRITTISDFIGSRYGNSLSLSALVTVIALIGITPYLGLQMKAIIKTYDIMVGASSESIAAGWVIALLVGVFAVIYGARRLDASERHEGLVMAVAFESVIKLAAFLMVGIFVTYYLFDGFGDIFGRISTSAYSGLLDGGGGVVQPEWASLLFLSTMAVMFLPRQFQLAVAENSDPEHIRTAMWLFPLYLLLINVFVIPVAFGGLLLGGSVSGADNFVLTIPIEQGRGALALLVFLGGFSAATGMVIVESLALSTMVMNSLAMPVLVKFNRMRGFPSLVLNTKRLVIMGCVFLGFFFAVSVGEFYTLVDMGLKSFEAVTLFAPPLLIGLYWKRGNRRGATAGLAAGFAVWLYTLLLPALARAGLVEGFGSGGFLDPHALFGLTGLDKWTHSLFWSLSLNIVLYVGVSIFTSPDAAEERQALSFVEPQSVTAGQPAGGMGVDEIEELIARHIGRERAETAVGSYLAKSGQRRSGMDARAMQGLMDEAELILAGSLGPAVASVLIRGRAVLGEEFSDTIMRMTDTIRMSREELEEANIELGLLKEFSQNIIESVPVGLATLDGELKVTYWNGEMERITGIGRQAAIGKPVSALGACSEHDVFAEGLRAGEFTCTGKGESPVTLKVTASPFHDPQGGYVMMFEDVTDKLRHEQELTIASKYASIGKLTAGLSHEIGNPLASISSLVQEIQAVDSPEFASEALGTVTQHIERIARIVRSLGDFARVKSPEKISARIEDVLERTISLTSFDKKFRKVEVVREVGDVPPVRVNPDQIQQVFLNMLLNSLDAMPEGGRITIRISQSDRTVDVSFSDTGTGMDKQTLERVFDPFFTTKPPGKGTGLGMSVCYGIIKEHGGSISAESVKGAGTTFRMSFPKG